MHIAWPLIVIACVFMVFDLISGFTAAAFNKEIESSKMRSGLYHKCGFMLAIIFSVICEYASTYIELGFTIPVQTAVCTFIVCIEIVSILENLGKIAPELKASKFTSIFLKDDNIEDNS